MTDNRTEHWKVRIRESMRRRQYKALLRDLLELEERFIEHILFGGSGVTLGPPVTINKEGRVLPYTLPSDQIALFPLRVNGAAPPAGDTFTVVSNNPDQFSAELDVMPPEAAADAGSPAVRVTCLTHNGATGVSFTVTDSNGDAAATETFDITAPAAPPPPAGTISIDESGIATSANPNPPTA